MAGSSVHSSKRASTGNNKSPIKKSPPGTSLAVQWLRLNTFTAGGTRLIPVWGTRIPHAKQTKRPFPDVFQEYNELLNKHLLNKQIAY